MSHSPEDVLAAHVDASIECLRGLGSLGPHVANAAKLLVTTVRNGGRILICGNGGSAAESCHFSTELLCRLKEYRDPIPAISLAVDAAFLTAVGNDYGFDQVFARQVLGLGRDQDLLIVLSTSGDSENIRLALVAAKEKGMPTIALLGREGGRCLGMADVELLVRNDSTARIQEAHLVLIHVLCSLVENELYGLDTCI